MSRIGEKPIDIPEGTQVSVSDGFVSVKGPMGELKRELHPEIAVAVDSGKVTLRPAKGDDATRALWGTYASHIGNMIQGVNKEYEKKLIVEGVGFKAELKGSELVMSLGFSHPVVLKVPEGVSVSVEKGVITVSGIDKELVGRFASTVRLKRKPEPYKGKGIRYEDEIVRRKQGKRAVA